MFVENVKAFIEKMNSDETFRNQIAAADSNEARLQLSKEVGIELSAEEFDSIVEQFSSEELSEEELDTVAGGVIEGVFKFNKKSWIDSNQNGKKYTPDLLLNS